MKDSFDSQSRLQHLYLRVGFGERRAVIQAEARKSPKAAVKRIFKASEAYAPFQLIKSTADNPIHVVDFQTDDSTGSLPVNPARQTEAQRLMNELSQAWLDRMMNGQDN